MTQPDPTPGQPADQAAYARGIRAPIETGARPCGHDDYHDGHPWHDTPGVWCPGISDADEEQPPAATTTVRAAILREAAEAQQQDQDPPAAEAHPAEELRAAAAKLGPSSPAVAAHTVAVRLHPDVVAALADLLVAVSYNPHDGSMDDPGTDRHDHCDRTVCIPAAALMAARVINREAQR